MLPKKVRKIFRLLKLKLSNHKHYAYFWANYIIAGLLGYFIIKGVRGLFNKILENPSIIFKYLFIFAGTTFVILIILYFILKDEDE